MAMEASEFCTSLNLPFPGVVYFLVVPGTPQMIKLLEEFTFFFSFSSRHYKMSSLYLPTYPVKSHQVFVFLIFDSFSLETHVSFRRYFKDFFF